MKLAGPGCRTSYRVSEPRPGKICLRLQASVFDPTSPWDTSVLTWDGVADLNGMISIKFE